MFKFNTIEEALEDLRQGKVVKSDKILIVIIGVADAVLIHAASENCVSKLIAA